MSSNVKNLALYTNIRRLCNERRISVAELERAAGIGNGVIRKWNTATPTLRTFAAVADVLGVSWEELLTYVGGGATDADLF